jgi:hypothetical protein
MSMSLKDWLDKGWLIEHKTSSQEIVNLLALADRDLKDCETPGLSPDWRMAIAYNAGLQAAAAALAASGYRAARGAHHYRVIQSLLYTVEAPNDLVVLFDRFRKKRNIGEYDKAGTISDQEAKEMTELSRSLKKTIERWLHQNHPGLLEG